MVYVINVDEDYDLPYAIAYAKLTWFVWRPLDEAGRNWIKITDGVQVSQRSRGSKVRIDAEEQSKKELRKEIGLWFDPKPTLPSQPDVIRWLYSMYPLRMAWASKKDFPTLFVAAILSPQVSWEVNTVWVRALYSYFRGNLTRIANCDRKKIDVIVKQYAPNVRRLGYHAKVLLKAIQSLVDKFENFENILEENAPEARKSLLEIYGVGPKVAMFLTQVTHGDMNAVCVDRHVLHNGITLGLLPLDARPYFPNFCKQFIDNCQRCPKKRRCAAGILCTYPAPAWVAALLYFYGFQ